MKVMLLTSDDNKLCDDLADMGYLFIQQEDGSEVILDEDHNEVGKMAYMTGSSD